LKNTIAEQRNVLKTFEKDVIFKLSSAFQDTHFRRVSEPLIYEIFIPPTWRLFQYDKFVELKDVPYVLVLVTSVKSLEQRKQIDVCTVPEWQIM